MAAAMPLFMVPEGGECRVSGLNAGRGLVRRLLELGFTKDTKVKVVKSQHRGPLIVQLKDTRFAISRGMAMKIMVEDI